MKTETKTVQIAPESLALYWRAECMVEQGVVNLDGKHHSWQERIDPWQISTVLKQPSAFRNIRPILKDPEKMKVKDWRALGVCYPHCNPFRYWDLLCKNQPIKARKVWRKMLELGYDMGGKDTEGNDHPSLIKAGLAIEAEAETSIPVRIEYQGQEATVTVAGESKTVSVDQVSQDAGKMVLGAWTANETEDLLRRLEHFANNSPTWLNEMCTIFREAANRLGQIAEEKGPKKEV